MAPLGEPLRVRELGRVRYAEAWDLQRALHGASGQWLLLVEHPHVFTLGVRADPAHVLVDPDAVGADLVRVDRGGDVTYHGPGQLVAYPILDVPMGPQAVPRHVAALEEVVIRTLADLGLGAGRLPGYPGVWVEPEGPRPRKICAIGVKVARGRSMHGLALNVDPDLAWFGRIVPCGIADKPVTSLAAEGVETSVPEVAELLVAHAARILGRGRPLERQAVDWARGRGLAPDPGPAGASLAGEPVAFRRLRRAGVEPAGGLPLASRKPAWLRVPARMGAPFQGTAGVVRERRLVTVCEEAGCPNIFECWAAGTATFMINGAQCTRSCGFCEVATGRAGPLDPGEPERVADAVAALGLGHAVVTAVARDDLPDGGAGAFAATVTAIRRRCPGTTVEVLVPDFQGDPEALDAVLAARPDVVNHNLETVARLQRAVRPQAGYARSLALLARAKRAGSTTKSGVMVGLGERLEEVLGALADLRGVGVDVVTVGQYLRPSAQHLPVQRFWTPEEFEALAEAGRAMGFSYVQASPLTRSSYHAREAAQGVGTVRSA
ncbi:lipoyl synthase [Aciditerrimonas ferrireducens]|uniref:Multifunctional fusion protein n=1 Tax=Aciditerrimonas ferrireducens TaxID=667306 RepID=A0ABV6C7W2_9ACTN